MNKKIVIGVGVGVIIVIVGVSIMMTKNQKVEKIPEINIPQSESQQTKNKQNSPIINSSSLCESACANYNLRCISLVPNANQELFNQAMMDCLNECAKWNDAKTQCILDAQDCESITDICKM
jgi:hypothetical protein